jgi:D-alanyl-D-alanine carboxypeptidase
MTDLQARVATLTQELLALGSGDEAVKSAVVAIEWAGHGTAAAAAGTARADTGAPMRVESQFHIASVAKPMTAALLFQAAEQGLLGREGIDARLIDTGVFAPEICRRLHNIDGTSYGDAITLRHMLSHTSGLRDAQIDDGGGTSFSYGGPAPNSIVGRRAHDMRLHLEAVAAGRTPADTLRTRKHWLPWDPSRPDDADAGLVNFYLNSGGIADNALFRPGEGFHYSDTAFTMLALLAEHLLGQSYHRLLRTRIFDPLGMHDSYLEAHSDLDPAPWVREVSDCWAGAVPLVSYGFNLSNDWGGGGVVATAADLNRFIRGLMEGKLFTRPETLAEMLRWQRPRGLPEYYTAVGQGVIMFTSPRGLQAIGHSGIWGVKMLAVPREGFFLSGTVNRRNARGPWMLEIADALLEH